MPRQGDTTIIGRGSIFLILCTLWCLVSGAVGDVHHIRTFHSANARNVLGVNRASNLKLAHRYVPKSRLPTPDPDLVAASNEALTNRIPTPSPGLAKKAFEIEILDIRHIGEDGDPISNGVNSAPQPDASSDSDSAHEDSTSNPTLILALSLSIPILFIFIISVIYCVYRRRLMTKVNELALKNYTAKTNPLGSTESLPE